MKHTKRKPNKQIIKNILNNIHILERHKDNSSEFKTILFETLLVDIQVKKHRHVLLKICETMNVPPKKCKQKTTEQLTEVLRMHIRNRKLKDYLITWIVWTTIATGTVLGAYQTYKTRRPNTKKETTYSTIYSFQRDKGQRPIASNALRVYFTSWNVHYIEQNHIQKVNYIANIIRQWTPQKNSIHVLCLQEVSDKLNKKLQSYNTLKMFIHEHVDSKGNSRSRNVTLVSNPSNVQIQAEHSAFFHPNNSPDHERPILVVSIKNNITKKKIYICNFHAPHYLETSLFSKQCINDVINLSTFDKQNDTLLLMGDANELLENENFTGNKKEYSLKDSYIPTQQSPFRIKSPGITCHVRCDIAASANYVQGSFNVEMSRSKHGSDHKPIFGCIDYI